MELRAFAEAVLHGTTVRDKLWSPGHFTDVVPGEALQGTVTPGRPAVLPFVSAKAIPAAPTLRSIANETVRGQALHTFAHHELQALELMALALLRFPDAPAGFRMGLAHIIRDEQRHFELYRSRAEHWGVGLGDAGVGHFFWSTVADLREPRTFLAALALTYEQANLDFAAYWKPAFAAVDDHESAEVLQQVCDDETRHVAHGVRWFARLGGGPDFQSYRNALALPLTPGRARGPVFNRQARLDAGFTERFVSEIEVHPSTRGRAARVFSFDPFVEEEVAGRQPKANVRCVQTDLQALPLFLAGRDDVVLGERPRLEHLVELHRSGFSIPEFVRRDQLAERTVASREPWGSSPLVAEAWGQIWNPDHTEFYDKRWAQRLAESFCEGRALCADAGEVVGDLQSIEERVATGQWIAKAPFSSSGQHRVRLGGPLTDRQRAWLGRTLGRGAVVLQPWHPRLVDVSVQIEVREEVSIVGLTRFWTAGSGAYRGAAIGPWTEGLSKTLMREVHGGERGGRVTKLLSEAAEFVGRALLERGFHGPAGVDAMVVRRGDGIAVVPILEVNPRYTMGRVAHEIRRSTAGSGAWMFLSRQQIERAHGSVEAFQAAAAEIPRVVSASGLQSGVLCTNDPLHAERIVTVLCLGRTLADARASWDALGMAWPD